MVGRRHLLSERRVDDGDLVFNADFGTVVRDEVLVEQHEGDDLDDAAGYDGEGKLQILEAKYDDLVQNDDVLYVRESLF